MSDIPFVAFNVLTVPEHARETLEERFAKRAGEVETMAGFRHFELLRPVSGTDSYLVYTRWDSKEDFDAWVSSMQFQQSHARGGEQGGGDQGGGDQGGEQGQAQRPAATGSEVWTFEAIQIADVPKE